VTALPWVLVLLVAHLLFGCHGWFAGLVDGPDSRWVAWRSQAAELP